MPVKIQSNQSKFRLSTLKQTTDNEKWFIDNLWRRENNNWIPDQSKFKYNREKSQLKLLIIVVYSVKSSGSPLKTIPREMSNSVITGEKPFKNTQWIS